MTRILRALSLTFLLLCAAGRSGFGQEGTLPESPGAQSHGTTVKQSSAPEPCVPAAAAMDNPEYAVATRADPCVQSPNPYRFFLDTTAPIPLTPSQKGYLAVRDVIDPFNVLTILANSAFTIGIDPHSAYGPGLHGFGRNVGVSLLQDVTGEFIGTFAVCSLLHQDPHYHRMPHARPLRRLLHAVSRTVIAQHDNGALMPNYENFITYPASAEISNLYVPGIADNGPSTVKRILTGLATDPVNNIITEFLPDVARRIHIRVVFVQQILNQVAANGNF